MAVGEQTGRIRLSETGVREGGVRGRGKEGEMRREGEGWEG